MGYDHMDGQPYGASRDHENRRAMNRLVGGQAAALGLG